MTWKRDFRLSTQSAYFFDTLTYMDKPIFRYDASCPFCRRCVCRWHRTTGATVAYVPFAKNEDAKAVRLHEPQRTSHKAEAVCRLLSHGKGSGRLVWCYERVPGFALAAETFYRIASKCRTCADELIGWAI